MLFLIGSVAFGVFAWWKVNSSGLDKNNPQEKYFTVTRGSGAEKIGVNLQKAGIIKSSLAFKIYTQIFNKADSINAGQFKLSTGMSIPEVVKALQGGPVELWVTIPEGKRREEISVIIATALGKSGADYDLFVEEFNLKSKNEEGYLFPDTYLFPPEVTASTVVDKLTNTFSVKFTSLERDLAKSKLTKEEVVTLASILERETKTDEERPIVAGILLKRLETPGWLIQADATVQYAIGNLKCLPAQAGPKSKVQCPNWWPILTREDLEIDSPFNSYKYKPLPPTPIANPGFSSLSAAVNPEESDYWFYIHDNEGQIHYAKTLSEHNINISKYLGK